MNDDGIKKAVDEEEALAALKRRAEVERDKFFKAVDGNQTRLAVADMDLADIERRFAEHQRRFSVVSVSEPATPYVKAIQKLWPTFVDGAIAEVVGRRPVPVLATFMELGGKARLIRQELPL